MGMSREELELELIHAPTVTFESQECVGDSKKDSGPIRKVKELTETGGKKPRVKEHQDTTRYPKPDLSSHRRGNKSYGTIRTYKNSSEN